LHTLHSTDILC